MKPLYVIFSPVTFDPYKIQRPHHLARFLSASGDVLFIEPIPTSHREKFEIWSPVQGIYKGISQVKSKNLLSNTPLAYIYRLIREKRLAAKIKKKILSYNNADVIIIFQWPEYAYMIPSFKKKGWKIVTDIMDDISKFPDVTRRLSKKLDYAAQASDKVTVTSEALFKKFKAHNKNIKIIRNGFEKRACKKDKVPGLVGYVGSIDSWFDYSLVTSLPYDVEVIGKNDLFKETDSVKFPGPVTYSKVPDTISRFSVCIIPFKINELTIAVNPVKVYEYLSCYRPVVATDLPELQDMPYVYVSKTREEFIGNIKKAMDIRIDKKKIDDFLKCQDWNSRFKKFLSFIR